MESFRRIMDIVGTSVDGVGVLIVVGGALLATLLLAFRRIQNAGSYYLTYRQDVTGDRGKIAVADGRITLGVTRFICFGSLEPAVP